MSTTSTPLRYPGGKSRLAPFFSVLLRQNGMSDCTYIEPFAGGAGAAINLLRREYVRRVYLNDVDPCIYAFWHSVLYATDDICDRIRNTPVTVDVWRAQREVLANPADVSTADLGFAVLYLNRTNRSGIVTGGVIGGQQQTGPWKIDARFSRDGLIEKIQRIGAYRDRIRLYCMDAELFLHNVVEPCSEPVFVYLDPPYYQKGQSLYENHYNHGDHVSLAKRLANMPSTPWVVTYDNVPEIREMYAGNRYLTYGIGYTAAERYEGREVMFLGPCLAEPEAANPLRVANYA